MCTVEEPAGLHGASGTVGDRIQVIPESSVIDPAHLHVAVLVKVIPLIVHKTPASGDCGAVLQIPPADAVKDPAAHSLCCRALADACAGDSLIFGTALLLGGRKAYQRTGACVSGVVGDGQLVGPLAPLGGLAGRGILRLHAEGILSGGLVMPGYRSKDVPVVLTVATALPP